MGGYRAVLLLAWLAICVTVPVSTLGMNEIATKEDITQLVNLIKEQGTSACEQDQMYKMVEKNFNSLNDKINILEYQLCQHMRGNNQCDVTDPHHDDGLDDGQGSTTPATTTPATTTPATTTPGPTFECSQAVRSGVYTITAGNRDFNAYCLVDGSKKWTVIQRRINGSVNFARNWAAYRQGFGDVTGEFWLGNEYIHRLTAAGLTRLRIDLEDWDNTKYTVYFNTFMVAGEGDKYRLTVSGFSGSYPPGRSMSVNTGMQFSTKDQDNDKSSGHCSTRWGGGGGWWWNNCGHSNLNGIYNGRGRTGICWYHWRGWNYSLKAATMMLSKP